RGARPRPEENPEPCRRPRPRVRPRLAHLARDASALSERAVSGETRGGAGAGGCARSPAVRAVNRALGPTARPTVALAPNIRHESERPSTPLSGPAPADAPVGRDGRLRSRQQHDLLPLVRERTDGVLPPAWLAGARARSRCRADPPLHAREIPRPARVARRDRSRDARDRRS